MRLRCLYLLPHLTSFKNLTNHKYGYIVLCMKTTVDLPDELLIEAKKRAAEMRCTLRDLLDAGLRAELASRRSQRYGTLRKLRWVTVDGGLPPDIDIADREAMHEWIHRQR